MGSFWWRSHWSEKEVSGCHQRHWRIFKFRSTLMNHSSLYVTSLEVRICISLSCFEKEKDVSWELHHAKDDGGVRFLATCTCRFWPVFVTHRIFWAGYELNLDDVLHKHNKEIALAQSKAAKNQAQALSVTHMEIHFKIHVSGVRAQARLKPIVQGSKRRDNRNFRLRIRGSPQIRRT